MNIGIFDSGIGGLNILKPMLLGLPNYTYIYYGDNANAPYGERSPEEIYDLTIKGIEFLFAKNCALVILACNTASTVLPKIQKGWLPKHFPERRVLGIIRPTVEHIIESGVPEIYLMATPATVEAKSYEKELRKLGSGVKINPIPCPGLAKAIENSGGKMNKEISALLEKYLNMFNRKILNQQLYLGCTHYAYVEDHIVKKCHNLVLSQGVMVVKKLKLYLEAHTKVDLSHQKKHSLYFSTPSSVSFELS